VLEKAVTRIASSENTIRGSIIAAIVNQSWLGVITAAKTAMPTGA
jgi:hypothetical protein